MPEIGYSRCWNFNIGRTICIRRSTTARSMTTLFNIPKRDDCFRIQQNQTLDSVLFSSLTYKSISTLVTGPRLLLWTVPPSGCPTLQWSKVEIYQLSLAFQTKFSRRSSPSLISIRIWSLSHLPHVYVPHWLFHITQSTGYSVYAILYPTCGLILLDELI